MNKAYPLLIFLMCALTTTKGGEIPTEKKTMPKNSEILNCVNKATELGNKFKIASAEKVSLDGINIPFLSGSFKGQAGIEVTFEPGRLKFDGAKPDEPDLYVRTFTVLLDETASQVLMVTAKRKDKDEEVIPEASPSIGEEQLKREGEVYHSLPKTPEPVTFWAALDRVYRSGIPRPIIAKEIDGYCVMYSRFAEEPHPVWIIRLRGIPAAPVRGDVPPWQITALRNVVDAKTGKWLFASNKPYLSENR